MVNKNFVLAAVLAAAGNFVENVFASAMPVAYEIKTVTAQTFFVGGGDSSDYFTKADQAVQVIECSDRKIRQKPINLEYQFAVLSNEACYVYEQNQDGDLSNERIIYSPESAQELYENDNDDLAIIFRVMVAKCDREMFRNFLMYGVNSDAEGLAEEEITAGIEEFKETLTSFLGEAEPRGYAARVLALLKLPKKALRGAVPRFIAGEKSVGVASSRTEFKRRASVLGSASDESGDSPAEEDDAVAVVESNDAPVAAESEALSNAETLALAQVALDAGAIDTLKDAIYDIVTADDKESFELLVAHCGTNVVKQNLVWNTINLEFAITNRAAKIIDCALMQNPNRVHEKMADGVTSMRRFAKQKYRNISREIGNRMLFNADIDDEDQLQLEALRDICASIDKAQGMLKVAKEAKKCAVD